MAYNTRSKLKANEEILARLRNIAPNDSGESDIDEDVDEMEDLSSGMLGVFWDARFNVFSTSFSSL